MKNKKIISGVLAVVLSLSTTEASFASCSQFSDAEKNGEKENYAGEQSPQCCLSNNFDDHANSEKNVALSNEPVAVSSTSENEKMEVSVSQEEEKKINTYDSLKAPETSNGIQDSKDTDDAAITEEGMLGENISYKVFEDGSIIISGYGIMNDFSSPAIKNASLIRKVTIQNADDKSGKTITSIGSHVFDGCINLPEIKIPDTVTQIGSYAFNGCSSLQEIIIPNSVETVGGGAFKGCSAAKTAYIGN